MVVRNYANWSKRDRYPPIKGHGLRLAGAPYVRHGRRAPVPLHTSGKTITGVGMALCECGWLSETLSSSGERQQAHDDHRRDIAGNDDWTTSRLARALMVYGIQVREVAWDSDRKVQVTLSLSDLFSLIDTICGSMSAGDTTGFAEDKLRRAGGIARIASRAKARRRSQEDRLRDEPRNSRST